MVAAYVLETRWEGLKPSPTDFRMALTLQPKRSATVTFLFIARSADMMLLTANGEYLILRSPFRQAQGRL